MALLATLGGWLLLRKHQHRRSLRYAGRSLHSPQPEHDAPPYSNIDPVCPLSCEQDEAGPVCDCHGWWQRSGADAMHWGAHTFHVHPPAPSRSKGSVSSSQRRMVPSAPDAAAIAAQIGPVAGQPQSVSVGFDAQLPRAWSSSQPPPLPEPVQTARWKLVNTQRLLHELAHDLSQVDEFAVDVEHHAAQSYLGHTCVLQIATGACDYLIDCLALWAAVGPALSGVFGDARIVKILHGGANDVLWLQRDFGVVTRGVWDTEVAAQVLGLPNRSLAHLLSSMCGVHTDKAHQRADWRQRPLPGHLITYARTDVHYLSYIAGQQRHALSTRGEGAGVEAAWARSQHLAGRHPAYRPPRHADVVAVTTAALVRRAHSAASAPPAATSAAGVAPRVQAAQLEALACWRDITARGADVAPAGVLSDAQALALVLAPASHVGSAAGLQVVLGLHAGPQVTPRHAQQLCDVLRGAAGAAAARDNSVASCPAAMLGAQGDMQAAGAGADAGAELPGCSTRTSPSPPGPPTSAAASASRGVRRVGHQKVIDPERQQAFIRQFSAKKEVYSNCRMLAQDGSLLCYCDQRKLDWYVSKGIAERVEGDPPTIRLLFQHTRGDQAAGQDTFYTQAKLNRCVVCGRGDHFLRYRVVPNCYRRAFPTSLKSHRSHDIVLLCVPCHQTSYQVAERTKQAIAAEYGIPLHAPPPAVALAPPPRAPTGGEGGEGNNAAGGVDALASRGVDASGVRRAAVALLRGGIHPLPDARRTALERVVYAALGLQPSTTPTRAGERPGDAAAREPAAPLTPAQLTAATLLGLSARQRRKALQAVGGEEDFAVSAVLAGVPARRELGGAAESDTSGRAGGGVVEPGSGHVGVGLLCATQRDGGHEWHGRQVVARALAEGGEAALHALTARFRTAFVAACHPQFLPDSWEVHHSAARRYGQYSVFYDGDSGPAGGQVAAGPALHSHGSCDGVGSDGDAPSGGGEA